MVQDPQAAESGVGLGPLTPWAEHLCNCDYPLICMVAYPGLCLDPVCVSLHLLLVVVPSFYL